MGVRDGDFVEGGRVSGVERELRDEEEVNDEPCDNEDVDVNSNFGMVEKFSGGVNGMVVFRCRSLGGESGDNVLDVERSDGIWGTFFWSRERERERSEFSPSCSCARRSGLSSMISPSDDDDESEDSELSFFDRRMGYCMIFGIPDRFNISSNLRHQSAMQNSYNRGVPQREIYLSSRFPLRRDLMNGRILVDGTYGMSGSSIMPTL